MIDLVIIGCGPVGLTCGIEAKRNGLDAVIVEKGTLVNSLVGYPLHMEFFSTPERLEIGGYPFATLRYKPLRSEALEYYRRVAEQEQLAIRLYERVLGVDGTDNAFQVITTKGTIACRKVVVATGFFDFPNRLGVPGEDLSKVTHYYREPHAYTRQKVAVIGGKNSAAKAALECFRHGADVTLIHRGSEPSDRIKYWILPDLQYRIRDGSIRTHFETTVSAIEPHRLQLHGPDGPFSIENDFVLAMTGYQPDYRFLRALGVSTRDDEYCTPEHDPDSFESNRAGLYLAGTVCGGLKTNRWFIENGRFHAAQIIQHITTGEASPLELENHYWKTLE